MFKKPHKYLIFDSANLLMRATLVKTADGTPTGYIFRVLQSILKYKRDLGGQLVFAFEGEQQQERYALFPGYKASRIDKSQDFDPWPSFMELVSLLKCTTIVHPNFEADDAIATFVKQHTEGSLVVSNDRDLWHLKKHTHVEVLSDISYNNEMIKQLVTTNHVLAKFNCAPSNIPMVKALFGDDGDDICKVPRLNFQHISKAFEKPNLNPTTFFAWCDEFLTHGGTKQKLADYKTQIETMFAVAFLREDLILKQTTFVGDKAKLLDFLKRFNCNRLCKEIDLVT